MIADRDDVSCKPRPGNLVRALFECTAWRPEDSNDYTINTGDVLVFRAVFETYSNGSSIVELSDGTSLGPLRVAFEDDEELAACFEIVS